MATELEKFLSQSPWQSIGVVESGGNHGDRLIYTGAKSLVDSIEFSVTSKPYYDPNNRLSYSIKREINEMFITYFRPIFQIPYFSGVDAVGIHGGANVNDLWGHGVKILQSLVKLYPNKPLVVFPHTYWFINTNFRSIFEETTQPIHLFCREEYSYSLLENLELPQNVLLHLSDDTAFHLNTESLREQATDIDAESGFDLLAFRDDRESIFPRSKIKALRSSADRYVEGDISNKSEYSYGQFLGLVDQAGTVYTDRLHVGILAHLLETDAVLYENAYFKTRGVYQYSLADSEYVRFESAI